MTSDSDKTPRVSAERILKRLKYGIGYGTGTTNEERIALLDLRDSRAACDDANKEVTALTVERGLLLRDIRIHKFNTAKVTRERDDAIAHADDFGAEVDRLRGEVEKWYSIAGKWMSELNDSIDKYNALRDAVQKVIAIIDNSKLGSQCGECGQPVNPMLDNAVQCLEYVLKDDDGEWRTDRAFCRSCGHKWQSVTPVDCESLLECPTCGNNSGMRVLDD